MAFEKYKPAARSTILDTNATTNLESLDGKALIERTLKAAGISEEQLAHEIGYATRTLKGVRYGEIPTSAKLRLAIQMWWHRHPEMYPKLQEQGPDFGTAREEEEREIAGQRVRVISPIVETSQSDQSARGTLMSPLDKHGEDTTAELMIELLHDYRKSAGVKRDWLASQIRDLARGLGRLAAQEHTKRI